MVYFIFSPDDPKSLVKIGFTNGPIEERLHALQVGCPFRLCLIMALDAGKDVEQRLHRKFHKSRRHGEWFFPTEDIRSFIRNHLGERLTSTAKEYLSDPDKVQWVAGALEWTEEEVRDGLAAIH